MTLFDLIPNAEDVLRLEPEEVAGVALELMAAGVKLHPTAFCATDNIGPYPEPLRSEVAQVLAEGWHWLVQEGLIAPRPADTSGWHFVTRRGKQVRNREGLSGYINSVILPRKLLHAAIASACWAAFLRGDYDTAVFQSFKELEVGIREAARLRPEDIGVDLARKAFGENGPLADKSKPASEQQALAHLVAGALGSYKNPHSHRKVELTAEESVEMIMLASHLLKIVASRAAP